MRAFATNSSKTIFGISRSPVVFTPLFPWICRRFALKKPIVCERTSLEPPHPHGKEKPAFFSVVEERRTSTLTRRTVDLIAMIADELNILWESYEAVYFDYYDFEDMLEGGWRHGVSQPCPSWAYCEPHFFVLIIIL